MKITHKKMLVITLLACCYSWMLCRTFFETGRRSVVVIKKIDRSPAERASFYDQLFKEEKQYTMLRE